MLDQKYFYIVSNVRAGSYWLSTSLDALPGVKVDFESTWKPDRKIGQVHKIIPEGVGTCIPLLQEISASEPSPVVGSKLTIEPYSPFNFYEVQPLLNAFNKEIRIIHLTRNYFDTFLSFEARGGLNMLHDPTRIDEVSNGSHLFSQLIQNEVMYEAGKIGGNIAEKIGAFQNKVISYDNNYIFSRMMIYLLNDLVCVELCRRAEHAIHVDYSEIQDSLHEIAIFVGANCEAEQARNILANPVTKKLAKLSLDLIDNLEGAKMIAAILDEEKNDFIRERRPIGEIWPRAGELRFTRCEEIHAMLEHQSMT